MAGALLHRGQHIPSASSRVYNSWSPTRVQCTLHPLKCRTSVQHTAWLHARQVACRCGQACVPMSNNCQEAEFLRDKTRRLACRVQHSDVLCRKSRGLAVKVRAGWNDFEWSKAKIVEHEKAGEGVSPARSFLHAQRSTASWRVTHPAKSPACAAGENYRGHGRPGKGLQKGRAVHPDQSGGQQASVLCACIGPCPGQACRDHCKEPGRHC